MPAEPELVVDGLATGGAVDVASISEALKAADEFVSVRKGRGSMDAARVDDHFALVVSDPHERRAASEAQRFATLEETVAALLAYASVGSTPERTSRRRSTTTFDAPRLNRETRPIRSLALPVIIVAIAAALAVFGAETEQSSGTGDPHPAALIGGLVCFVAFLAVMLMFTIPYVMHRLEKRLDVEIASTSLLAGWQVVDSGRFGAKIVVGAVSLGLLLSILLVPLALVIGAAALR